MRCPNCFKSDSKVTDKRDNSECTATRRRRECLSCSHRFTTYERIKNASFLVEKKSGIMEDYSREKLKGSILKGLKKRRMNDADLNRIIEKIEEKLRNKRKKVVTSEEIGRAVLEELKTTDQVAYMLYATVYQHFENIDDLAEEIENLKKHKKD